MLAYYVRFGRRHRIPSTVEILDELRSGLVPDYVRKSWAQHGFIRPPVASGDAARSVCEHTSAAQIETQASPQVFPPLSTR
jgi:hypothetical protein